MGRKEPIYLASTSSLPRQYVFLWKGIVTKMSNTFNRLAKEKSPYLLQHATNPVEWYPWGPEAFAKAKAEDKPVFLSIGYSTCHWCHVMEHESFCSPEIARILNDHFIAVKVDREERPDIDKIYMQAVMAWTGSGGWPMSVFLTSDQHPFFGGTYFPPEPRWGSPGFRDVLLSVHAAWGHQREKIEAAGQSILEILQSERQSLPGSSTGREVLWEKAYQEFEQTFDVRYGGFGSAPKFPMGHNFSFLLRYWGRTKSPQALKMVEDTLTAIHRGGIYDHLGGGFHRYATDSQWQVPHFEKMLYDQALLVRAYGEAYQATGYEQYAQVVRETLDYVLRDLSAAQGGFFCAEDADSVDPDEGVSQIAHQGHGEKKEGSFYLWRYDELMQILGKKDGEMFVFHYGMEPRGNAKADPHGEFIGKNILYEAHSLEETSRQFSCGVPNVAEGLQECRQRLMAVRQKRPRPHLDDKIITDWNGLMIAAMAFGGRLLGESRYIQAACRAAHFILQQMRPTPRRLLHRYRDGQAAVSGMLDDYAFFIEGLLMLYEATWKVDFLVAAVELAEGMIASFRDEASGGFFMTDQEAEPLIIRPKEVYDGAIPSGVSMAAMVCIKIYHLTQNIIWRERAEALFENVFPEIQARPSAYCQFLIAWDMARGPVTTMVLTGDQNADLVQRAARLSQEKFLPYLLVVHRPMELKAQDPLSQLIPSLESQKPVEAKPAVYMCDEQGCRPPIVDAETLEKVFKSMGKGFDGKTGGF
jgi:uncharacterized protein YyaL (SSP411 family)